MGKIAIPLSLLRLNAAEKTGAATAGLVDEAYAVPRDIRETARKSETRPTEIRTNQVGFKLFSWFNIFFNNSFELQFDAPIHIARR